MSLIPVHEVREMVTAARRFVAGDAHFTTMVAPTEACSWWARVHGVHPVIQQLAAEWREGADLAWNEYGQHPRPISVAQYRQQVASDLGE
jgi:hypothetical protein